MQDASRLTRRAALLGLAGTIGLGRGALAIGPRSAGHGDRRLVVIILRGAMDGLSAVVPYGDGALAGLRAGLLPAASIGAPGGLQDLGGFYGLHPALATLGSLYRAGELLPIHAIAGHDRSRSHFEAQDYLESGADERVSSGWLNRAVGALPAAARSGAAVSLGIDPPLLVRGPAPVGAWAPERGDEPAPALLAKVVALCAPDRAIHAALVEGIAERAFSSRVVGPVDVLGVPGPAGATTMGASAGLASPVADGAPRRSGFVVLSDAAGRLLAAPDGPRVAALEIVGWDTHQGQDRALAATLGELDRGIAALRAALGPAWRDTAVLAVTEFGRTARINGTGGTDHGTGTVAFLAGGSVAGGRVLADWPGLGAGRLFENRDLAPTRDLRGVTRAVLARQLGLSPAALRLVLPGSAGVAEEAGLFRA